MIRRDQTQQWIHDDQPKTEYCHTVLCSAIDYCDMLMIGIDGITEDRKNKEPVINIYLFIINQFEFAQDLESRFLLCNKSTKLLFTCEFSPVLAVTGYSIFGFCDAVKWRNISWDSCNENIPVWAGPSANSFKSIVGTRMSFNEVPFEKVNNNKLNGQ